MSESFFQFKKFKILNPKIGLKITTDACLLGALCNKTNAENILDIGTGTGVLSLMVAQKNVGSRILAIEINEAAFKNAEINIYESMFNKQIELIHDDFINHQFKTKFDLIISNPPYFTNNLKSENQTKNFYIHNETLDIDLFLKKTECLMSENGEFWLIMPHYEMDDLIEKAATYHLFPKTIYDIDNLPGKNFRKIVSFYKIKGIEPNLIKEKLFDAIGKETTFFKTLMQPYYLDKN